MKFKLLLFCCLTVGVAAQEISLQELVNRKQFREVLSNAKDMLEADSADHRDMYIIGQAYEGLLRYPEAYRWYRRCLAADTANIDFLNTLGRMAINLGRASDAQNYFQKVLENDSINFYANYQLGRLYQQLSEYIKAINQYHKLLEQDEFNPVLLRSIGDCFIRMELLPAAKWHYSLAYDKNKENVGLANALINTMLKIGDEDNFKEALSLCDTALFYNPVNQQLIRNKGMALFANKKYGEADSLYTNLLEEGDSTLLTLKYAGASRYYHDHFTRAIDPLEKFYEKDTTDIDVCLLLGSILGKKGEEKKAFELLGIAENNMRPDSVHIRQLIKFKAETYRQAGKFSESDKLFYQAWKDNPSDTDMLRHIASRYDVYDVANYGTPDMRQRGIFIRVLYVRESLKKKNKKPEFYQYHRYFFETLYNDMFFRSVTEEPMLAPDGKKTMLNVMDLRYLINQLPEIPDIEKGLLEKHQENEKKSRELSKMIQEKIEDEKKMK